MDCGREQRHPGVPGGTLGRDPGKLGFEACHLGLDDRLVGEAPGPVKAVPAEIGEEAEGSRGDGDVECPEPHHRPSHRALPLACSGEHETAMVNGFISHGGPLKRGRLWRYGGYQA